MYEEETGFSFKDMLVYCFLHWRSALVLVLVGAMLGGGYYWYKGRGQAQPVADVPSETEPGSMEHAIETQNLNYSKLAEYYDNSLLMNIDPSEEYIARADLLIKVRGYLPSYTLRSVVTAYTGKLRASETIDNLADKMGTTPAFLRELVTINDVSDYSGLQGMTAGGGGVTVVQTQDEAEGEDRLGTVIVQAIGSSAEDAEALREAVLDDLDSISAEITDELAAHSVEIARRIEYVGADPGLLITQNDAAIRVNTAANNILNDEKNLTGSTSAATPAQNGSSRSLRSLVKGAIMGAAGLFLLYGFVLLLRYVLGGSPLTRGQVEGRYGLPELGAFAFGDGRLYRGDTAFDRWLRRLAGMGEAPDAAEAREMVAANVRLYAGDACNVLVTSSTGCAHAAELASSLGAELEGYGVSCAADLLGDAKAREALDAADAVVVVEEYGKSRFASMDAEIELAVRAGKRCLGIVMA